MWAGSVYLIINDRLTLSGATEMLRRYLKRKTGKAVYKQHTLNGSQIISEQRDDKLLVFLYDESGSPIGMQYRTNSMAEGTFYTYLFEKNLQGDIIAIYNTSGTKLISYVYDAWGNFRQTNHNISGTNAGAQYNPFMYRGYYYDTELDFYYLQSRYYDPEVGRFINPDSILNANGDILGYNLYLYCSNNPVMLTDESGRGWNEFWQGVGDFFSNIGDAFVTSIEFEFGIGTGIGAEVEGVAIEYYNDTFVGFDDGVTVTGHTSSVSLGNIQVACKHYSEKGDIKYFCKQCDMDYSSGIDYFKCETSEKNYNISVPPFSIDHRGDVIIGASAGFHFIYGAHISIGFNISECIERLFD